MSVHSTGQKSKSLNHDCPVYWTAKEAPRACKWRARISFLGDIESQLLVQQVFYLQCNVSQAIYSFYFNKKTDNSLGELDEPLPHNGDFQCESSFGVA